MCTIYLIGFYGIYYNYFTIEKRSPVDWGVHLYNLTQEPEMVSQSVHPDPTVHMTMYQFLNKMQFKSAT